MGNQKQKWTAEEEEALLGGVAKHGPGKWKNILKDPEFAPFLTNRSNIDLKPSCKLCCAVLCWLRLRTTSNARGRRTEE
nr:isoform 2 of telomere repeat-binding factor 5 [Quercus suber]